MAHVTSYFQTSMGRWRAECHCGARSERDYMNRSFAIQWVRDHDADPSQHPVTVDDGDDMQPCYICQTPGEFDCSLCEKPVCEAHVSSWTGACTRCEK